MIVELKQLYEALEMKRQNLFDLIYMLSADQTTFRIGPSGWSIQMHLEHVIIAEELIVADIRRLEAEEGSNLPPKSPESFQLVMQALERDAPVGVPLPELEPTDRASLEELIIRWEKARTGLKRIADSVSEIRLKTPLSRHPVAGSLDARETLEFIGAHLDHHRRNIQRIRDAFARGR
ncbi:MAG: DinB family protein [Desulfobacterales bacterium]